MRIWISRAAKAVNLMMKILTVDTYDTMYLRIRILKLRLDMEGDEDKHDQIESSGPSGIIVSDVMN